MATHEAHTRGRVVVLPFDKPPFRWVLRPFLFRTREVDGYVLAMAVRVQTLLVFPTGLGWFLFLQESLRFPSKGERLPPLVEFVPWNFHAIQFSVMMG